MIALRPYQAEAVDAIRQEWARGCATLAALATGAGKTEIFLAALDAERKAGRMGRALIIAHRAELIAQPMSRIHKHWPDLQDLGPGVVMAQYDDWRSPLIVATIQTLAGEAKDADGNVIGHPRLDRVLSAGPITHVVIDEAHHATAATYQAVIKRVADANPDVCILGVTATPQRSDETALGTVFNSVAYRYPITAAIKGGALVPLIPLGVTVPVSIKNVTKTAGDWGAKPLATALDYANVREIIVETWKRECAAPLMPTITFSPTRQAACNLADSFNAAGIPAGFADSTTPAAERQAVLDRFRRGDLHVLCNCALWTEGVDLPMASCIMVCRPTQSDSLYIQMAGRGLRLWPGKDKALVIDFVPADARDMRMAGDLLDGDYRDQIKRAVAAAQKAGVVVAELDLDGGPEGDAAEAVLKILPYLAAQRLAWTLDGNIASASAGKDLALGIRLPNGDGQFRAYAVSGWDRYDLLGEATSYEDIVALAEDHADTHGTRQLGPKRHTWRRTEASPSQQRLLSKWRRWTPGMTRGQASQAITHKMVQEALAR